MVSTFSISEFWQASIPLEILDPRHGCFHLKTFHGLPDCQSEQKYSWVDVSIHFTRVSSWEERATILIRWLRTLFKTSYYSLYSSTLNSRSSNFMSDHLWSLYQNLSRAIRILMTQSLKLEHCCRDSIFISTQAYFMLHKLGSFVSKVMIQVTLNEICWEHAIFICIPIFDESSRRGRVGFVSRCYSWVPKGTQSYTTVSLLALEQYTGSRRDQILIWYDEHNFTKHPPLQHWLVPLHIGGISNIDVQAPQFYFKSQDFF
jgi:hypothetical protein